MVYYMKMKTDTPYCFRKMPDTHFGVDIFLKSDLYCGTALRRHWHEHLQFYYFISGSAFLDCGNRTFTAVQGDVVIINSCEPHFMESLSDDLSFYIVRIDLPFLFSSQADLCQTKFLVPLSQNRITFCNLIRGDIRVSDCISGMITEFMSGVLGYELAVKSGIYRLIVLLLRGHIGKILSGRDFTCRQESLKRFDRVLDHIGSHYEERITAGTMAQMAHVTLCYFCRVFRQITGRTMTEYVNAIRLEKSAEYLEQSALSVTEIALRCGFDSVNYYSRLFRRTYHSSPSAFRKSGTPRTTLTAATGQPALS